MSGIKWMYISKEGEVFKVPHPKDGMFKAIPQLASQTVLEVCLYYETKDRKPWKMLRVDFDRITLNNNGQYLSQSETHGSLRNFLEYGLITPEQLSEKQDPWVIPKAPVIPNKIEKEVLIHFLKDKYPLLWQNSPEAIEIAILNRKNVHNKYLSLIRTALALKKNRGKS